MTVKLELISHCSLRSDTFPLPLLFIHGANAGAWVWDTHFLPFFARHGYNAHALSLRGHGTSSGADTLRWTRLADYVADIDQTIYQIGGRAILVGHSMGATIVLKYLTSEVIPAAVLMAPVPAHGLWLATTLLAWRDPALFWTILLIHLLGPETGSYAIFRRALFANTTPDSLIRPYFSHVQTESPLAIMEMMGLTLPKVSLHLSEKKYIHPSLLVCGADQDALFPRWMVRKTAELLGTTASFFHMGHAMMLEPNWEEPATHIHLWLKSLCLSSS